MWLLVVCGVVILRVRGIGLVFAGGIVCLVSVDGSGAGRVVVVGGHADVVGGGMCVAWFSDCSAVDAVFLVVR